MCRNTKSLAAARRPSQGHGGRASILTAPPGVPRGLGRRPGAPSQAIEAPTPPQESCPLSAFPERGPAAEQRGGEVMGPGPHDSHPGAEGVGPEGRGPRPRVRARGSGASPPAGAAGAPSSLPLVPRLQSLPEGWESRATAGSRLTFGGASSQEHSSQKHALAWPCCQDDGGNSKHGLGHPGWAGGGRACCWLPSLVPVPGLVGTWTPVWGAGTHGGPRVRLRGGAACRVRQGGRRAGGPGTRMGRRRRGAQAGHRARLRGAACLASAFSCAGEGSPRPGEGAGVTA